MGSMTSTYEQIASDRSRPQTYNHARSHMLDCAVRRRALLPRELVRFRGRADGDPRVRRI